MDDILEDMRWKFFALRIGTRDRMTMIYENDKYNWMRSLRHEYEK